MKKVLLIGLTAWSCNASALELGNYKGFDAEVLGRLNFNYSETASDFDGDSFIGIKFKKDLDYGNYGIFIKSKPLFKDDTMVADGTHLFFETTYGRWELGTNKSVNSRAVSAYDIAGGTCNVGRKALIDYATVNNYDYPILSVVDNVEHNNEQYLQKITYYSPELKGLQVGFSYIPKYKNTDEHNGFAGIISHKYDFTEDMSIKTSISGDATGKFTNYASINIGTVFTKGNFAIAGSYTLKKGGKNAPILTMGVSYAQGPVGVSVLYFVEHSKSNPTIIVGTDYVWQKGITFYAEGGYFAHNEKPNWANLVGVKFDL